MMSQTQPQQPAAPTLNGGPQKKSIASAIHIIFGLFMMLAFGRVFSPVHPLTEVGMQVLGVFIGTVYLWCFVSLLWPSLFGILALALTDFTNLNPIFAQGFGANITVLFLFVMILFGSAQHVGITKYISRWFLTRRIINGRPSVFNFIFIFCAYAIGAPSNPVAALALMWPILYSVLKEMGYKVGDKYSTLMVIGTFLGAISGQAALPFQGSALGIIGVYQNVSGATMPFIPYIIFGFIMSTLGILGYVLLMKFVFKPDMSKMAGINTEMFDRDPLPPMNKVQKANCAAIISFLALMVSPVFLPDNFFLTGILNTFGPAGIVLAIIGIMCIIKSNGTPLLNFKEVAGKYINWDIWLLVVAAMAISNSLTHVDTGIVAGMMHVFTPVLGGLSPLALFIVILLISIFLTSFANTMIMGMMLIPILINFGAGVGINIPATAAAMIFLLHYAIILPASSPFAAMLWGNKEWLNTKDIFKYAFIIVILATVLFIGLGIPLSQFIFGLFGYN